MLPPQPPKPSGRDFDPATAMDGDADVDMDDEELATKVELSSVEINILIYLVSGTELGSLAVELLHAWTRGGWARYLLDERMIDTWIGSTRSCGVGSGEGGSMSGFLSRQVERGYKALLV